LKLNNIIRIITVFILFTSYTFAQTDRWRVIWDANPSSDNVTFYEVYSNIGDSSESNMRFITTVDADSFHTISSDTIYMFIDSEGPDSIGLRQGELYYYRIKAVSDSGRSKFSNAAFEAIPEIKISEFRLPVSLDSSDISFYLNQTQYVEDLDDSLVIDQFIWDIEDLIQGDSIQHFLENFHTLKFITPSDSTIQDMLLFKVFDTDSFYDVDTVNISLLPVANLAPVSSIPDQTVINDSQLTLDLDDYVHDNNHTNNQLTWTVDDTDIVDISINLSNHIATIAPIPLYADSAGIDTVIFRVTDPTSLFDDDSVVITILGRPVVSDIPDESIDKGLSFSTIDLDDYVDDPDHNDNELVWAILDTINLSVDEMWGKISRGNM